ncbi:MAG: SEC-C metal-binding domain-containing protein [bacterium]
MPKVYRLYANGDHAGERYTGVWHICTNATCACNTVHILFRPDNEIAFENCQETFEYMLLPKCGCTEACVGFQPYRKDAPFDNERDFPEIFFDYKSKKWREDTPGSRDVPSVETLVSELKSQHPNIPSLLKQRHVKLKRLYKNYRREHIELHGPLPSKIKQPEPGRNDPCPCGSGKKYKNCCMEL